MLKLANVRRAGPRPASRRHPRLPLAQSKPAMRPRAGVGPRAAAAVQALDIGVNSRQAHKSGIHRSCKISTQDFRLVRSRWYCKRYMPFQGKELFSYGACETL